MENMKALADRQTQDQVAGAEKRAAEEDATKRQEMAVAQATVMSNLDNR